MDNLPVPLPALVAGATAVVGAKSAGYDLLLSIFLGVACCLAGTILKTFLKQEQPADIDAFAPKNKLTKAEKKEKKRLKKEAKEETVISEKALKKKADQQAKKEKKKAEKAAQKAAEDEAKKKEEEEKAAAAASSGGKKKKKKKKNAATEKAEPKVEAEKAPVEDDDWNMVPVTKKSSKKSEEVAATTQKKEKVVHEATIEFECDPKHYPKIMGVGGSNLKALQDATGTEIDIPKKGGIRTSIVISGTKAGVLECKKNLAQLAEKGYCAITQPGTTDQGIEIPQGKIGSVMGRGGEYVKAIAQQTGAKIDMPDRDSGSNRVTITGSSDAVAEAMKAIKQLIEKGFSDITHANHTMVSINVHRDSLGTLLGTRGATIKKLQEECRVKINIPKSNDEMVVCSLVGEASDIINARIRIEQMLVAPEPEPIAPEWTQENILKNLDLSW